MDVSRKVAAVSLPLVVAVVGLPVIGTFLTKELVPYEPATVITVDGIRPEWTPADLLAEADAIAIVEPTGQMDVHWNSADRRQWGPGSGARVPWIYRDDRMRLVRTFRGSLPEVFDLRGVGGTVGDVHMDYVDQPDWQVGQRYLVLLEQEDTPTKEGFERMWSVFQMELGTFVPDGPGRWRNVDSSAVLEETDLQ